MLSFDDVEDPVFEISHFESVYSHLMFSEPGENHRAKGTSHEGKTTCDTLIGYILVVLSVFLQGLLLYCVYTQVVGAQIDWEGSIMYKADKPDSEMALAGAAVSGDQCNPGKALCTLENKTFACAPPTVKLTGRWEELDTNGDGIWTRDEVVAAKDGLQCRYIVNPVEVFDVFVAFLKNREKIIWLHPDVKNGIAIPKPYFTYASGDIIMCGYRNEKMCPNLLKRGVFDAALQYNTVPRVGNTIKSALFYCSELLKQGGMCERSLPSTYSVWKVKSDNECGSKSFNKFVYKHPTNPRDFKSMVSVDYSARKAYAKTLTPLFKVYKTIIIGLWVMAMVFEGRSLVRIVTWVINFPNEQQLRAEGKELIEENEDDEVTINGATPKQRAITGIVTLIRVVMLSVLAIVGTSLLLQSQEYMGLIFDAVSLVFIIDIASILYTQVLRPEMQEQSNAIQPMMVRKLGIDWVNRRPGFEDALWLAFIVLMSVGIMVYHYAVTVKPMGAALLCTCLSKGDECDEAQRFSFDFWYDYWRYQTPKVFKDVDVLKASYDSGAALIQTAGFAAASGARRAATQLVQHSLS